MAESPEERTARYRDVFSAVHEQEWYDKELRGVEAVVAVVDAEWEARYAPIVAALEEAAKALLGRHRLDYGNDHECRICVPARAALAQLQQETP